jgi:hypothetical protein
MRNIDILKQFLKDSAKQIREVRIQYKKAQRSGTIAEANGFLFTLLSLQYEYRHHHIVYCELRGKTREQIEPKVRKYHEANEFHIGKLKEKYAWTPEEIKAYEERNNAKALCANS